MKLNNLKIYCQTEDDQADVVEFIYSQPENVKISTWEPDGDDENPGSWGIFVDDFPQGMIATIEDYLFDLLGEDCWELDLENLEKVEMWY